MKIVDFIMQKLRIMKAREVNHLIGEVVFLTKQVSNRDETIKAFEELARLGIDEVNYEDKV